MSVNFMPGHLVRQFHVRHFQSTHLETLWIWVLSVYALHQTLEPLGPKCLKSEV